MKALTKAKVLIASSETARIQKLKIQLEKSRSDRFILEPFEINSSHSLESIVLINICELHKFPLPSLRSASVIGYGPSEFLHQASFMGWEDYLKEPWDVEELEWKVSLVLQRKFTCFPEEVYWKDGRLVSAQRKKGIRLNAFEHKLLSLFMNKRGELLDRDYLNISLGILPSKSRRLDIHIHRLRKKLNSLFSENLPIQVFRGKGYWLLPRISS